MFLGQTSQSLLSPAVGSCERGRVWRESGSASWVAHTKVERDSMLYLAAHQDFFYSRSPSRAVKLCPTLAWRRLTMWRPILPNFAHLLQLSPSAFSFRQLLI
ncbi:hypothetical protein GGI43DRAFT_4280 [Trichoderma evansii]